VDNIRFLICFLLIPIVFAIPPQVIDVTISSVFLNSGDTKQVMCNASIFDPDGNISIVNATIFDTSANQSSPDDNNNHYTNSSCTFNSSGNMTDVFCGFDMQYYSNPSEWVCNISAYDEISSGSNHTNFTVEELKAMSITPISYHNGFGQSIPLDGFSVQAVMNITNEGNVNFSLALNGTDIQCETGSIGSSNQRFSSTQDFSYYSGVALTHTKTNYTGFYVDRRTDDSTPSLRHLYWLLKIASTGAGGDCTGIISLDAK